MANADLTASDAPTGFRNFIKQAGPAWIVSAVACGPATMASVAIAGGKYGYGILWVVVLSAFLAFVVQYMAAKAGIIGQKGIMSIVEEKWGSPWAWLLMIDALFATWLAAAVLMKSLVGVTNLIVGTDSNLWALFYAALIFVLLVFGGYKLLERVCKILVSLVVLAFVITVIKVRPDLFAMVKGLVPMIKSGADWALISAGIMGGAVHITIIAMHTYNVNARGWGTGHLKLARLDTFLSMFVAFGLYSVAILLASAVVLYPEGATIKNAFGLANVLKPVLGPYAGAVFMAGLWAAVISTISPTFLAGGYFLADKLKWDTNISDNRFKAAIGIGVLISLTGVLLKGNFMLLLVIMLALGLCGTPFIILALLLLLNSKDWAGENKNGWVLNIFGVLALVVTTILAARFLISKFG